MSLLYPIGLSIILFAFGVVAFFVRRSLITAFMAVELMLNACNLTLVSFAKWHGNLDAHVMVLFIMAVAAAEAAVGLAILIYFVRCTPEKSGLIENIP